MLNPAAFLGFALFEKLTMIRFQASQSVSIALRDQPLPIGHYLKQPQRLVKALVDSSRVQVLEDDLFRLHMRSLSFMTVHIQPVVDIRVWSEPDGAIRLQSVNCEIRGNDYINQRFRLFLDGFLSPITTAAGTQLEGNARLSVDVELPPAFLLTPRPILETSGNGLLKSVLLTIKQRLSRQLLADYSCWVKSQQALPTAARPAVS